MSRVNGRNSHLPLRIIIFTEKTESNLRILWEMTRESMLLSRHSTLLNGGPGRVFTWEIGSKDRVCEKCLRRVEVILTVEGMNVEQRDGEDPQEQPRQDQHA